MSLWHKARKWFTLLFRGLAVALCIFVLLHVVLFRKNNKSDHPPLHNLKLYFSNKNDQSEFPVKIITRPPNRVCKDVDLVILIKSSVNHSIQRNSIRETWASYYNKTNHVTIFVMGKSHNMKEYMSALEESEIFKDIVVGNFLDTYENLTVKSRTAMDWSAKYCSSSKYVILGDDDIFMSIPEILKYYMSGQQLKKSDILHCGDKVIKIARVKRRGKWSVPQHLYPRMYFPQYCNGPCFIMSQGVAQALHREFEKSPVHITVDDALITGIFRENVGLSLRNMRKGLCTHLFNSPDIGQKIKGAWMHSLGKLPP